MRECGDCSLCCKLLDVPGLAPAGEWCSHVEPGKGCSIYDDRPEVCRGFACVWLRSEALPVGLKPNRCGIVFENYQPERLVIAMVDKHKSENWKKGAPRKLITGILKAGYIVWVRIGKVKHLLLPPGVSEPEAMERTEKAWSRKAWQPPLTQKT